MYHKIRFYLPDLNLLPCHPDSFQISKLIKKMIMGTENDKILATYLKSTYSDLFTFNERDVNISPFN